MEFGSLSALPGAVDGILGLSWLSSSLLLVTTPAEVKLYNITDQQCTRSWMARSISVADGATFSVPAVQHARRVYCVMGDSTVVSWAETAEDASQLVSRKVTGGIVALAVSSHYVLLTLRSGGLVVLSPQLEPLGNLNSQQPKCAAVWSVHARYGREKQHSAVCTLLTSGSSWFWAVYAIHGKPGAPTVEAVACNALAVPVGVSFVSAICHQTSRAVSILWSDSTWQLLHFERATIPFSSEPVLSTPLHLSIVASDVTPSQTPARRQRRRSMSNVGETVPTASLPVVACDAPHGCLVLAGNLRPETGAVPQLCVWDIKRQVILGECALDIEDATPTNSRVTAVDVAPDATFAAVCVGKSLFTLPLVCKGASVLTALGKAETTRAWLSEPSDVTRPLTCVADLRTTLAAFSAAESPAAGLSAWADIVTQQDEAERKVIEAVKSAKTSAAAARIVEQYLAPASAAAPAPAAAESTGSKKRARAEAKAAEAKVTEAAADGGAAAGAKRNLVSNGLLAVAIARLVDGDDTSAAVLRTLLRSKRVSASQCPTLVPLLLKHGKLELVEECIRFMVDIPELTLKAIDTFVASKYKAGGAKPSGAAAHAALMEHFVCVLLRAPRNDVFLERALHALTASEVSLLFTILNRLLLWYDGQFLEARPAKAASGAKQQEPAKPAAAREWPRPLPSTPLPTLAQTLEWARMVTDAHFPQLVLFSTTQPQLASLLKVQQERVSELLRWCESVGPLRGHLLHFMNKEPLPIIPVPDYSIEVLKP